LLSSTSASASTPSTMPGSPISTSWFRRLDELSWVRKAGLVESGTGNVLVWGAPNVDNIGRLGDRVDPKGRTRGI
jgi:cytochrome c oxidase assembly factor 3